ncbi:CapA family protein [Alkalicoccus daliensis]|uniref:GDSL-like Lipase/Acylhydrolase n=1 Tax=Alkalicoccus daliensis TaxID=745820 RepID=A0A1H0GBY1_9BACI|nr:CapA family protein [Alkalicoccus daliensis]SDO04380.1 GDSL-like Lipase/Acylhydrolase [Alkalicoccus daliensis]
MKYETNVLTSQKNYKITYHKNVEKRSEKVIITFGEIDSNLEETGFGDKLIYNQGYDYIYVAQKRTTQYQFLSADKFSAIVEGSIAGKEVYTYGSSLGAYGALYFGGAVNANILAMSPRIPAHPVINKLMDSRFKNKGFKHKELHQSAITEKRVCVFFDEKNYIDRYYVDFFIKVAYPDAEYHALDNAGHYTARALLESGELKQVAVNFFQNTKIEYIIDKEKILDWHLDKARKRVKSGKLAHAIENIEALLSSERASQEIVRELAASYQKKVTRQIKSDSKQKKSSPEMHPIIKKSEKKRLEEGVCLSFVGSLILFRDQVLNAYDPATKTYEFSPMFTYVKKHLAESDFAMGVFEGPTAGEKYEYSTSCYGDALPLTLNFPDSYAREVKQAGFDFVTTAHNHLLDCGEDGAMRTFDILDEVGLKHRGGYRNQAEKEKLPIYEIKGLKVAILAYTHKSNGYDNNFFLKKENKHLTSLLVSPNDENFEQVRRDVKEDFERIKRGKPDCIVVLPHMGQQFRHSPDSMQTVWCDIFVEEGADLILSDHPQAVQPYEWRKNPIENTDVLILHCPGNFVNSYTAKDGDASAFSHLYLDPKTGKPFAAACIPLYAHSYLDKNYKSLPIFDIIHNPELRKTFSTMEYDRVKVVHELITGTMLGESLPIDQLQEKYYLFADRAEGKSKGYVRNQVIPLEKKGAWKNKAFYQLLKETEKVCFIGDSITEGTQNGGYGWYEPITAGMPNLEVVQFSIDGGTTSLLEKNKKEIVESKSDLYVVALGTNDVRYRDPKRCAMTPEEYTANIDQFVSGIREVKKDASFVFIAPWTTDNHDPVSKLKKPERFAMLEEYSKALETYCSSNKALFIDPNKIIYDKYQTRNPRKWLTDHIHPNALDGINLFSWAVLEASPEKVPQKSNPFSRVLKKVLA